MSKNISSKDAAKVSPKKILLIQDKPREKREIRKLMGEQESDEFSLDFADRLSAGLKQLSKDRYAAVLLDLGLLDSQGVRAFTDLRKHQPDIPVIIHSHIHDENTAIRALRHGAQDVLETGHLNSSLLLRSIRYAIERQRLLIETRKLSLIDDLTGLYNRRGFLMLSEEQLKIYKRSKVGMHFLFIDMDHLKDINDRWGHNEGDNALMDIAMILKDTRVNSSPR